jgi:tetratricopeptide (TPR) repeat protein
VQSVFARAGLINAAHLQARLPGKKEAGPALDRSATGARSAKLEDAGMDKPGLEPVSPVEAVASGAAATSNLFTSSRMPVEKADAFAGDPAGPVVTERSISWNNLSRRVIGQLKAETYADAVDSAEELTREFPERWESWYWKGTAQLALGQLKESDASLEQAGMVDPGVARVWLQRAVVAQERGDNKAAVRLLLEARKLAPKSPQIYLNLGYSNDALGLSAEAEKNYQYFMALTEGDAAYLLQRTLVIERLERK